MLTFSTGETFATGAMIYGYHPYSDGDLSARIILPILVEGNLTNAILDTGAPYLICSPSLARQLGLDPETALSHHQMLIRGYRVRGSLHRLSLTLLATGGDSLAFEAISFIPDLNENFEFPTFVGLLGCLEWIRFAIDPSTYTFYFGACS